MISMNNVSKWYGSFQVLTDCSTEVAKGEVVVVCGPSGSGKSTLISPFWNGSRPLTVLMSVDLPLPEGPHTTTTSPFDTSVLQSVSTWNWPYHLETFLMEIIG